MVDIQSKEVIDKMSEELKVQPSLALPRKLMDSIQPVFEVGGTKRMVVETGVSTSGSGAVIFTTPATQDFFLTNVILSYEKDVVSDNVSVSLQGIPFGQASKQIIFIPNITLTASKQVLTVNFIPPIRIARANSLIMLGANTAGVITKSCTVTGFVIDPE